MYAPPSPPPEPNPDRVRPTTLLLVLGGLAVVLAAIAAIVIVTTGDSKSSSTSSNTHASSQSPTTQSTQDIVASCKTKAENYVRGASTVDYRDMSGYQRRLKNGVSPELAKRFDEIGNQMSTLFVPMQMVSTATIVSTQTELHGNSCIAIVTTSVHTTSTQNPQGQDTTTVYKATIDSSSGLITDISDPRLGSGGASAPTTAAPPTS